MTVIDDWYAAGLAGTGSKSFTMDEVFVPPHRIMFDSDAVNGTGPGSNLTASPVFRMPRLSAATALGAVPLGVAYGLVEEFCGTWQAKAAKGRRGLSEPAVALRVAEATSELDCARWLLVDTARETMAILARGEDGGERAAGPQLPQRLLRRAAYPRRQPTGCSPSPAAARSTSRTGCSARSATCWPAPSISGSPGT